MKFANVNGRSALVRDDRYLDLEKASNGRLPADPARSFEQWADVLEVASSSPDDGWQPLDPALLDAPSPRPRQVFAIGLNYRKHAEEAGLDLPSSPATFTKFPSSITGPYDEVQLPTNNVDWEVELVAVLGKEARYVTESAAWDYVAGVTVGQDLSERIVQVAGGRQFSLGKSFAGFAPIGPWLVTPDELPDRDDLALSCAIGDETLQESRTSDLVFSVPELIAHLSQICTLYPGDVIFTGTPSGVGNARTPKRFLQPGETLTSTIEGIGRMANPMCAADRPFTF